MNRSSLSAAAEISNKCIECGECQAECAFLQKYGQPKKIADAYRPADRRYQSIPFECSLCGLCAAVCPVNIDPSKMFLEMRREMVWHDVDALPEHPDYWIMKEEERRSYIHTMRSLKNAIQFSSLVVHYRGRGPTR